MKHRFFSRTLSACLAAALTAALALPAFASGSADYTAADGTSHTVRWAKGIADPNLPADGSTGDFSPATAALGGENVEVLAAPNTGSQGFYDLTISKEKPEEAAAAAAANMTYWWIRENLENIGTYLETAPKDQENLSSPAELFQLQISPSSSMAADSPIYQMYLESLPREAKPDQMLDFFLSGYAANGETANHPDSYSPAGKGGYLYPVVGKNLLTRREAVDFTSLKDAIAKNQAAIITVKAGDEIRYMNVWGVETDDAGKLNALLVTDSMDELGLVRYSASYDSALLLAGMEVTGLYTLNLGEEQWMAYGKDSTDGQNPPPADPQPTQPPQVEWENATYQWSENLATCTATRVAKGDPAKVETENVNTVSEQTKAPSKRKPGIMTYTADFAADWAETQVQTREIPKTGANWDATTYEWDESMRVCTAIRRDKSDPSVEEKLEGVISSKITREPTCNAKGQTTFTAVFDQDWAETQTKVVDDLPQLTPIWGETQYQWAQDHKSCTAVRVCKHEADGSHRQEEKASVTWEQTKAPTSQSPGETTYYAKFNVDWAAPQQYVAADIPAVAENWGAPTYEWSQDLRICYAKRTDLNDSSRVQTAETGVTSRETKAPTCTEYGETTYTASFQESWAQPQTLVKKNIPTLQPNWGETEYRWSQDHHSCTAVRTCKNEANHQETAQGRVSSQVTAKPTATSKGETTYVAEFNVDWAGKQVVAIRDVPEAENRWNATEYQWSNDMTKCTATRKNANDSTIVETASAKVSSKKTKAPTASTKGETTYTAVFDVDWAKTQKKTVANIPAVNGNPNPKPDSSKPSASWNEPTYEWSEDHSRCTARRTKKGDESTVDLTSGTVTKKETKPATCAAPGEAVYTAKFTEKWAKDQTVKAEVPTLDHKLQKVEEIKATAGKEGMQEHYMCTVCMKLFADAEGKREVTKEQLKLNKPGVTEGYAIVNGVPEKDSQVAIGTDKLSQAIKDNPGSVGVSIAVGSCSLSYDKKDVETIVNAAGDNPKLQLEIYKADATDPALTLEQIQTAERNPGRDLYLVQLSYVQNGKSIPVEGLSGTTVTVPYAGTDAVRAYRITEEGGIQEVSCRYKDSFLSFAGGNGVFLLSETQPEMEAAPQKHGPKIGVIIWSTVLVISGLLGIGLIGFYLYQKKLEADEAGNPHKFTAVEKPKPRMDQNFSTDQVLDYDEGYYDEPTVDLGDSMKNLEEEDPLLAQYLASDDPDAVPMEEAPVQKAPAAKAAAPKTAAPKQAAPKASAPKTSAPKAAAPKAEAKPQKPAEAKTPLAPRAPMEQKTTIAEKTAESANNKHSKV